MITLDSYRKELSAILERELGGRNIQEVYLSDGGYVTFVSMTTEEDKQNLEPYVGNPNEEFKFDEIFREFFGEGDALEILKEHLIELIVVRLRFDQYRAAEVVKSCEGGLVKPEEQAFHQRHPLVERYAEAPGS